MESRIYIFFLIQCEFSLLQRLFLFFSCELSDYGWFRIENEKLQTEKFNPSRAVIEIVVGGVACV